MTTTYLSRLLLRNSWRSNDRAHRIWLTCFCLVFVTVCTEQCAPYQNVERQSPDPAPPPATWENQPARAQTRLMGTWLHHEPAEWSIDCCYYTFNPDLTVRVDQVGEVVSSSVYAFQVTGDGNRVFLDIKELGYYELRLLSSDAFQLVESHEDGDVALDFARVPGVPPPTVNGPR